MAPTQAPTLTLTEQSISSEMAAHLTLSLLGHVLFLKSQVPFPVAQLGRMPGDQKNQRAKKRRLDLLETVDLLQSHLPSSFSAVSTALAQSMRQNDIKSKHRQVLLALVLGPSVASAKSVVFLGLDGVEAKAWGAREVETNSSASDSNSEDISDEESSNDEDNVSSRSTAGDEEQMTPPRSRSPSPSGSSRSHSADPEVLTLPQKPLISSNEDLLKAERAFSRMLLSASCQASEDGSLCPSNHELAPTLLHICLRVPRRFKHPEWVPKQAYSKYLDRLLQIFLDASTSQNHSVDEQKSSSNKKMHLEGVWIQSSVPAIEFGHEFKETERQDDGDLHEDDELIWWSWNGKIQGFTEW